MGAPKEEPEGCHYSEVAFRVFSVSFPSRRLRREGSFVILKCPGGSVWGKGGWVFTSFYTLSSQVMLCLNQSPATLHIQKLWRASEMPPWTCGWSSIISRSALSPLCLRHARMRRHTHTWGYRCFSHLWLPLTWCGHGCRGHEPKDSMETLYAGPPFTPGEEGRE